jgi:hypothetical protein
MGMQEPVGLTFTYALQAATRNGSAAMIAMRKNSRCNGTSERVGIFFRGE